MNGLTEPITVLLQDFNQVKSDLDGVIFWRQDETKEIGSQHIILMFQKKYLKFPVIQRMYDFLIKRKLESESSEILPN